jgi:FkbM family methyltransferase
MTDLIGQEESLAFVNLVISKASSTLFDRIEYEVRNGLLKGLRRRGGLGWIPIERRRTAEDEFWASYPLAGKTVFDVGAFHGLLTLHFARHAKSVVAFEPNPVNWKRLDQNVRLNGFCGKVAMETYGLAAEPSMRMMQMNDAAPGTSSLDDVLASGSRKFTIRVSTLDQEQRVPDLIKIDVEGLEDQVLEGGVQMIQKRRPDIFLEMHGDGRIDKIRRAERVLELLKAYGYTNIIHVESGRQMTAAGSADAAHEGHLFASGNSYSSPPVMAPAG